MPDRYCLHLRLQTIFDGCITAFAATPPLSGWWHASTPLSTRNLRLFFRLLMPGRYAPSFSPKPLTSLTAASPTHRGERMHGVTPVGRKRIYRSGRVGLPLIPPRAARFIPSMPEQPAVHGTRGRLSLKRKHLRESLSLHCIARHPLCCLLRQRLHFPFASRQFHSPKTDTSPAHLDYTPTPAPDARTTMHLLHSGSRPTTSLTPSLPTA